MAYQLSGTTWIDNNGHIVNGFKSINGTALAGNNTITTGPGSAATFGTNWNVVGNITVGYVLGNFNASGNFFLSAGYQRRGLEQDMTTSASNLYMPTYNTSGLTQYRWVHRFSGGVNNPPYSTDSTGLASGTWKKMTNDFEDPSWTIATYGLYIRIS